MFVVLSISSIASYWGVFEESKPETSLSLVAQSGKWNLLKKRVTMPHVNGYRKRRPTG